MIAPCQVGLETVKRKLTYAFRFLRAMLTSFIHAQLLAGAQATAQLCGVVSVIHFTQASFDAVLAKQSNCKTVERLVHNTGVHFTGIGLA